jgi:hypothetical protein
VTGILDLNKERKQKDINILKEFKVRKPRRRKNKILENDASHDNSIEIGVRKNIKKSRKVKGYKARQNYLPKRKKGKRKRRKRSNEKSSEGSS